MAEEEKTENVEFSKFTRVMAKRCDNCALCNHARKNPESMFGRVMEWHGTWCPAWKAQKKVYGG